MRWSLAKPAVFLLLSSAHVLLAAGCGGAKSPIEEKFEDSHRNWTFLANSAQGDTYYYYNESLIKADDGKEVTIWIKTIDLQEVERIYGSKTPEVPIERLAHTATKVKVYCDEEALEYLEASEVDKNGSRSSLFGMKGKVQTVIPDTIGHTFYNAACYSEQNVFRRVWNAVTKDSAEDAAPASTP